jgi:hypothetical protein
MKIFDLHAHPSLKSYGNFKPGSKKYNIWKKRYNKFDGFQIIRKVDKDGFFRANAKTIPGKAIGNLAEDSVALYSQSNLDEAVKGNVRCIVLSFYPVEQEFFKRGSKKKNHFFDKILSMISGQSVEKIDNVQDGVNSYYKEYEEDRKLLAVNQASISEANPGWKYKIVRNYTELQEVLENEKEIAIILSIEGVQSLAGKIGAKNSYINLKSEADKSSPKFLNWKANLLDNLTSVKQSKSKDGEAIAPVLFVTIAHHFFNFVCGHCKSLKFTLGGYMLDQEDSYHHMQAGKYLNTNYFDLGIIDPFGYEIINEVLRRDPTDGTRRIIVDIKHLSPKARLDFYKLLDSEKYKDEKIPIICSHTSVNGLKEIRRTTKKDANTYFNAADINTFDEDLIQIYKRDGLIGIMLDDGRSCSKYYKQKVQTLDNEIERKAKRIRNIENKYRDRNGPRARRRMNKAHHLASKVEFLKEEIENEYCEIFFRQVFHIVNVLNNHNNDFENAGGDAWNIITLGTDFDGVINPFDYYGSYSRMDELREDLIETWNDYIEDAEDSGTTNDFTRNLFGRTPEYWINKVFWENSQNFLKKYFNDDYLINGVVNI